MHADAGRFLEELERSVDASGDLGGRHFAWLAWCRERVARYRVVQDRQRVPSGGPVNPYYFIERLFAHLGPDDIVVCGDGTAHWVPFQAAYIQRGQRLMCNLGCGSMGYDLPAAIGAAVGSGGKRVVCLAGDGSIQLNIQELQTVVNYRLPIKIFVLNNGGYLSMRETQKSFFGRYVGEGPASGVSFPDITKLAGAYGLPTLRLEGSGVDAAILRALAMEGPVVGEVMVDANQRIEPRLASRQLPDGRLVSPPLEDMAPLLDAEELQSNLLIEQGESA